VQTLLTSVLGAWHLLSIAQLSGARLLHASAGEVYGDPQVHPQAESYRGHVNAIGPRACYDEGKRCAETLCFAFHHERGVPIRIGRIFDSYGPRLRPGDGRVVSNFIVQALRGEPLTVYGDGLQTRSFCDVDDTIEGLWRLMDAEVEGPLNIGHPIERTVLDLAEIVLRLTGSRPVRAELDSRSGRARRSVGGPVAHRGRLDLRGGAVLGHRHAAALAFPGLDVLGLGLRALLQPRAVHARDAAITHADEADQRSQAKQMVGTVSHGGLRAPLARRAEIWQSPFLHRGALRAPHGHERSRVEANSAVAAGGQAGRVPARVRAADRRHRAAARRSRAAGSAESPSAGSPGRARCAAGSQRRRAGGRPRS
jgi:hypothetical protein